MKILVFSDSHRSRGDMIEAIDEQQPDQVIHLGDLITDAEELTYVYPRLPICMVPGNCDGWTTEPVKKLITLQGKTILLSHGHLWRVKGSYDAAIADARKAGGGYSPLRPHPPRLLPAAGGRPVGDESGDQPQQLRHHSHRGRGNPVLPDPADLTCPTLERR